MPSENRTPEQRKQIELSALSAGSILMRYADRQVLKERDAAERLSDLDPDAP
ncbi:MAG: hypothetical protein AAGD14_11445 [Planctomycetota bacterium]